MRVRSVNGSHLSGVSLTHQSRLPLWLNNDAMHAIVNRIAIFMNQLRAILVSVNASLQMTGVTAAMLSASRLPPWLPPV